ncbi:MAG: hypothetical protein GX575_03780 [Candidatus Anammoximicrobium sp.]|nr:hypothetical protein [Candidatus Anammoximicrobium sp.]
MVDVPARLLHPDEPIERTERVALVDRFGHVVQVAERPRELAAAPVHPWLTLLTCIFLHGGREFFGGEAE